MSLQLHVVLQVNYLDEEELKLGTPDTSPAVIAAAAEGLAITIL